jgi:arylsulfatase A
MLFGGTALALAADSPARPNIIVLLADDLGFEQIGAYGAFSYQNTRQQIGPTRTPQLDALAQSGLRFRYCFSAPVCSPARGELLTGKYNFRLGLYTICGRYGSVDSIDPLAHPTLAATLGSEGYVTAVTGKWHLGKWKLDPAVQKATQGIPPTPEVDTDCPHVRACGFQRQFVFSGSRLEDYGKPTEAEYVPARFSQWAMRFLDSRKGKSEPFFLYYASPIPHVPLMPTPLNPDGKQGNESYPFLIEYLDKQVGELVTKLDELGMRENTLILFAGDNGSCNVSTRMRDGNVVQFGKGTMRDTGAWVPLIANWPVAIRPGRVYDGLVDFSDLMPTFLELAGAQQPQGLDGISFAAQLRGEPGRPREWVHVLYVDKDDADDGGQVKSAKGKSTVKLVYYVRDAKFKLRENGDLYDVSQSPYAETLIPPENDSEASKAARSRLRGIMLRLHGESK